MITLFRRAILVLAVVLAAGAIAYAWNPALVLAASFRAAWWIGTAGGEGGECTGHWSPPIDARMPYLVPFYPETRASYRVIGLAAADDAGRPYTYRLDGIGRAARYHSVHLYDGGSGDFIAGRSDETLGVGAGEPFTLRIGAAQTGIDLAAPPGVTALALVERIYLGEGSEAAPRLSAFDADGAPAGDCPSVLPIPASLRDPARTAERQRSFARIAGRESDLIGAGDAAPIRFYALHAGSVPFFANPDVVYGFATLDPGDGRVALVSVPLPPLRTAGSQMTGFRYLSACLGGERETSTSACLSDTEMPAGGVAKLVIGGDDEALRATAAARGAAFLDTGWFTGRRVLIVRQLDTRDPPGGGDPAAYAVAPDFTAAAPLDALDLSAHLGAAAPRGAYCASAAFLSGGCVFP